MRKKPYKPPSYQPHAHYTGEQLLEFRIRDLAVDLECAVKNGHLEYAAEVRKELDGLLAQQKKAGTP